MKIFNDICIVLRDDERAMLATIIATKSSTPAPAHSRLLIRTASKGERRTIGTIGGGCLDYSILCTVNDNPTADRAKVFHFNLNDDIGDTGLCCGGALDVLLEPLSLTMLPIYEQICEAQAAGSDCILVTGITPSGATNKSLLDMGGTALAGQSLRPEVLTAVRNVIDRLWLKESAGQVQVASDQYIIELLKADPPLIIFGAGHVGRIVAHFAALVGFRVTVVDDRPEFANREKFPEAHNIICDRFDETIRKLLINPETYVVIVTRGHRHDEEVLEMVLHFDPKYIGMIGSKRKVHIVREHIAARGVDRERLAQVHAPIGVPIGAETPEEIGISIVAELIAVRRKVHVQMNAGKSISSFFPEDRYFNHAG